MPPVMLVVLCIIKQFFVISFEDRFKLANFSRVIFIPKERHLRSGTRFLSTTTAPFLFLFSLTLSLISCMALSKVLKCGQIIKSTKQTFCLESL